MLHTACTSSPNVRGGEQFRSAGHVCYMFLIDINNTERKIHTICQINICTVKVISDRVPVNNDNLISLVVKPPLF